MWSVTFVVVRNGERSKDDGSPRFLDPNTPFPVPDIDQSVIHRGEMFVVDDVIWDLERKSVLIEIVSPDEEQSVADEPVPVSGDGGIEIEDNDAEEADDSDAEADDSDDSDAEADDSDGEDDG